MVYVCVYEGRGHTGLQFRSSTFYVLYPTENGLMYVAVAQGARFSPLYIFSYSFTFVYIE